MHAAAGTIRANVDARPSADAILLPRALSIFAYLVLAATLGFGVAVAWPALIHSPDSWTYFELAKSFGTDPYRFNTFRSYVADSYSGAFPFGYPILLHLLHRLLGARPELGIALNIAAVMSMPVVAEWLVRRACGIARIGFLCGVMLALFPPFMDEVIAARAMPIAILLALVAVALIGSAQRGDGTRCAAAGIIMGCSALVRFDSLFFGVFAASIILAKTRSIGHVLLYLAGLCAGVAPWSVFSWLHFGTPFYSDNSWVALSAVSAFVTDYPAAASETLFTDPWLWLGKIATNLWMLAESFGRALMAMPSVPILFAVLPVLWPRGGLHSRISISTLLLAAGAAALALAPQVATGYVNVRYLSFLMFWLAVVALALNSAMDRGEILRRRAIIGITMAAVVLEAWLGISWLRHEQRPSLLARMQSDERIMAMLARCQSADPATLYLFIGDDTLAAKYGAITGHRSGLLPRNWVSLEPAAQESFARRFSPLRMIDVAGIRATLESRPFCASPLR